MTYRHPSVFAAEAITIDHASGGRLELAYGAAWFDKEHHELGIPFPALDLIDLASCNESAGTGEGTKQSSMRDNTLHAYPMPADDRIQLELPVEQQVDNMYVLDAMGRRINTPHLNPVNQVC
jgi:hypothetical protein